MPAQRRTNRDTRRRQLGQNFLSEPDAERILDRADVRPDALYIDIGAGRGVLSRALARRGARVIAVEPDPAWAARLRALGDARITIVERPFAAVRLPSTPFRVLSSLPFGATTDILRRLLDDPSIAMARADVIVQWEVAKKRTAEPPATLLSAMWAPWWEFRISGRIPASAFRPIPRVDGGVLTITKRRTPLLPLAMAPTYGRFLRESWPFPPR
ncbi:MAG: hypothetical protein GC206_14575 [Alphaproteobacteria bacterium]|nr:hypothetical protein [Alphaproteobacteria bacterium]